MLGFEIKTSDPVSRLATQPLVQAVLLPQHRQIYSVRNTALLPFLPFIPPTSARKISSRICVT